MELSQAEMVDRHMSEAASGQHVPNRKVAFASKAAVLRARADSEATTAADTEEAANRGRSGTDLTPPASSVFTEGAMPESRDSEGDGDLLSRRRARLRRTDEDDLPFTSFQAVLSSLPQHALDAHTTCCPCSDDRSCRFGRREVEYADKVQAALLAASKDYPQFSTELQRMVVVHVSLDIACFVDHSEERCYTAVRGTSPTVCRDLCNDMLIALGRPPKRASGVMDEYRAVRERFPTYQSYGCGHSLGGTVMHEMAYRLEREPDYAFQRVDVFNAGGSPLRRRYTALSRTEFNAHRVAGDPLSSFYVPPGGNSREDNLLHERRPGAANGAHGLENFLPMPRRTVVDVVANWVGATSVLARQRARSMRSSQAQLLIEADNDESLPAR